MITIAKALDVVFWIALAALTIALLLALVQDPDKAAIVGACAWVGAWLLRKAAARLRLRRRPSPRRKYPPCPACGHADHAPCAACSGRPHWQDTMTGGA